MYWFKALLLILIGLDIALHLVKGSGWDQKIEEKLWHHAVNAIFNTLIFLGIWAWL